MKRPQTGNEDGLLEELQGSREARMQQMKPEMKAWSQHTQPAFPCPIHLMNTHREAPYGISQETVPQLLVKLPRREAHWSTYVQLKVMGTPPLN